MCLSKASNPSGQPCHNITDRADVGQSGDRTIAGLDQRLFSISIADDVVEEIASVSYPKQPKNRALPLPLGASLHEQLLLRPTFFETFDIAVVDWQYVLQLDNLDHLNCFYFVR